VRRQLGSFEAELRTVAHKVFEREVALLAGQPIAVTVRREAELELRRTLLSLDRFDGPGARRRELHGPGRTSASGGRGQELSSRRHGHGNLKKLEKHPQDRFALCSPPPPASSRLRRLTSILPRRCCADSSR